MLMFQICKTLARNQLNQRKCTPLLQYMHGLVGAIRNSSGNESTLSQAILSLVSATGISSQINHGPTASSLSPFRQGFINKLDGCFGNLRQQLCSPAMSITSLLASSGSSTTNPNPNEILTNVLLPGMSHCFSLYNVYVCAFV
jgi:hypothetical protein